MKPVLWLALLVVACAQAPAPDPDAAVATPSVEASTLLRNGAYQEALGVLAAWETDDAAPADGYVRRRVLRAWAEAGLGDCRLAAEIVRAPPATFSEAELKRFLGRAAELAIAGMSRDRWWREPPVSELQGEWSERVEAAQCVLEVARGRFAEDAVRIDDMLEVVEELAAGPPRLELWMWVGGCYD